MTRARRHRAADTITAALRRYADRGVFRGLRVEPGRGGRNRYEFLWLTRRPMRVVFDARRGVVAFPALFPHVQPRSPMGAAIRALVAGRSDRQLPAHKRLDKRRARVTCSRKAGALTLAVTIRGAAHDYALRNTLNLVNELFLLLQETYPDYLVEHFGASSE